MNHNTPSLFHFDTRILTLHIAVAGRINTTSFHFIERLAVRRRRAAAALGRAADAAHGAHTLVNIVLVEGAGRHLAHAQALRRPRATTLRHDQAVVADDATNLAALVLLGHQAAAATGGAGGEAAAALETEEFLRLDAEAHEIFKVARCVRATFCWETDNGVRPSMSDGARGDTHKTSIDRRTRKRHTCSRIRFRSA